MQHRRGRMPSTPPPSLTHQHVSLQSSPVVHRHRGLRAGAAAMAAAAAPTFRLTQCLRCSRRLRYLHGYRCLPHQSRPPDADDADGADGADDRAAQAPVPACALLTQVAFMATSACDGRVSGWAWSGVVGGRGKRGGRMQRAPALSVAWRRSSQPSARPSHAASSRARSGRRPRRSFRRFITALVCFVPRPRLSFRLCFRAASIGRTTSIDDRRSSVGRATHTSCHVCLRTTHVRRGAGTPRGGRRAHTTRTRARSSGRRGGATTRGGAQTSAVGGAGRGGDGRGVRARRCTSAPRAVLPLGARMACCCHIY